MAKADLWQTPAAIVTYLSTELNALANAARVVGAAIDNRTTRYKYMMLEHYVGAQTARSAGAYVSVYLLASVDATNYPYGATNRQPSPDNLVKCFALDAAVTASYSIAPCILIPPLLFILIIENNTGQAYTATGNTVKYRLYSGSIE